MPFAWLTSMGCEDPHAPAGGDSFGPLDACEFPGNVCTWLGIPGQVQLSGEGTDRLETSLFGPLDITFASDGTAFYPEPNHRIRKVSIEGIVTTVFDTDFPLELGHPTHLALDPSDDTLLYVTDSGRSRLGIVDTSTSTLTWLAGTGNRFYSPGLDPTTAMLDLPSSIAFGPDGSLYFSDQGNHLIRKIATDSTHIDIAVGQIESVLHPVTMLPTFIRQPGFEGDGGDALLAKLHGQTGPKADPGSKIVADSANHRLLIADTVNGVIRAYALDTGIIDTIAGRYDSAGTEDVTDAITGITSTQDIGSVPGYGGDGGDALEALFNMPCDVAVGIDGEIYIADTKNHCVRVLRDGIVERFAGICTPDDLADVYSGDGGPALDAVFSDLYGVEVDAQGNVYIADYGNHVIRRVKYSSGMRR